MQKQDVAAVIIEGIQGIGGIDMPSDDFLRFISELCLENRTLLILDEIQSGYGRSGNFFAHQYANIKPDIITVAKGMGNGFPMGGVLISPSIEAEFGMLGTTFGGNHLACAAGIAVLDILKEENLIQNARLMQKEIYSSVESIPAIQKVKGRGLMLGISLDYSVEKIRSELLLKHRIFTGASADPNLLRILPPLSINVKHVEIFIKALKSVLS